jgi:hypothetical protein
VNWHDLCEVILFWSEVSWYRCCVLYGDLVLRELDYIVNLFHLGISCTAFVLICTVVVLNCFVMCGCVCVCVCVGVLIFGYPDWDFSVLFPQLWDKFQGKTRKDWARPALFQIVICVVFVICVVLLLIVMFYVLFVCKCVLPPGVYPIAVYQYQ